LICALTVAGISLWCLYRDRGKVDGDYAAFLEDDFDQAWFDVVIEGISEYPVLFPPDIEPQAGPPAGEDSGYGPASQVPGGAAVAKIKTSSGFWLCPLSSLVSNPSIKCRGSAEIATRTGGNPCTVTLYWHEYGGYTAVVREK
jgi:hypothetical protein